VGATINQLTVADVPAAWARLGFAVEGNSLQVGELRIRMAGSGRGLHGWTLSDLDSTELDGLPTWRSDQPRAGGEASTHPNGVTAIDHVVATTPALERTMAALQAAGLELRRIREEPTPAGAPRQAFFRLGAVILEVIQEPPEVVAAKGAERPASFWGLAFVAPAIEATVADLGERVSEIRPAVQPGRRIASLRRSAGLSLPVALITPLRARD
jgi:hypothetical protein